jgi:hypothetical protein
MTRKRARIYECRSSGHLCFCGASLFVAPAEREDERAVNRRFYVMPEAASEYEKLPR